MPPLQLGLLGALQITRPDGSPARLESDKARALLAYLAVEADQPHRREALIGLLWPDDHETAARHNLRQALFNLRQAIGDPAADPPYLLISRDDIQFNLAGDVDLDLARFSGHLAARADHAHPRPETCSICATHLRQALELYRGRLLQEFFLADSAEFEAWALARREALHQRALEAATDLAGYYEQQGDLGAARQYAIRQLELDPWREPAHRQLMRVLARDGQRAGALAQYEAGRRILADELGVEPARETRELHEQIRAGHWTPAADSPKPPPPTNLPVPLTPFIGRELELADLQRLLADPVCRCLTLVGPGGIGKTRLAVEAASRVQATFPDGVYFVSLAPADLTRLIVPMIAEAIGFGFQGTGSVDPRTQLFSYLKGKKALLLTDNLEHLVAEPGIEVLADLLASAPQVKLLATSRELSGLRGEWVFEVQGLPIPAIGHTADSEPNSCVELFLQRARRAHVGFNATAGDYPAIDRICRLVDGMPLGIELAAAWVRTLDCAEIAHEIERGLDFLRVSTRELPDRHRSMRAVFDHSWKLLSAAEQTALLRLSVFRGGFRREAAELVADATLSVLSTLVAKSLVRRSGAGRYDLHELIRQYGAERYTNNQAEQSAAQARHGRYYLTYFSQTDGRLRSSLQRETLAELTAEMDNLRAAWDWAVAHGEFSLVEQTMRAFWMLYDTRGWFQEGVDTLERAANGLEIYVKGSPADAASQVALAHFLANCAWFAYRLAQYGPAQAVLERSLEILRPLNEPRVLAELLAYFGMLMEVTGRYARAMELYSEGLETATAVGDRLFAALCRTCLYGLAAISHGLAQPENAHEQLRSAMADWRAIGDPRMIAFGLRIFSQSAFALGRYAEARAALEESASINNSVGDRWGLGSAIRGLGVVDQAQGQHQQAVVMFRKALDTFTELGGSWWVARVLAEMGRSLLALGNEAEARSVWRKSLRIATETRGTPVALEALAGFASLQAKRGQAEHALELLLIVMAHPASIQDTRNRAEQLQHELGAQLTSQQIEAVQVRAQAKRFEAAVDEVLQQADLP